MAYRNLNISIGLVNVPVSIDPLFSDNRIKGNRICAEHRIQVKQQNICPDCGGPATETTIGYQTDSGNFVTVDLDEIKVESSKNIALEYFTSVHEIDPIFFDATYVIYPRQGS